MNKLTSDGKSDINKFRNKKEIIKYLMIMIIGITISIYLAHEDYLFFHSLLMFIGIIICFAIFLFAWNTYEIARDDFFMVLGVGYGVVGIIDILHTVTYFEVGTFGLEPTNLTSTLWIVATIFECITVLVSSILLYKSIKRWKIKLASYIYLTVLILIVLCIYKFHIFPASYIQGVGNTLFNKISRYIIIIIFLISMILFYKARHKASKEIIIFTEASIILRIINELLFSFFSNSHSVEHISAFVLRTIAFYMLYKAVVRMGLKKPFQKMYGDLRVASDKLAEESTRRTIFEEAILNSKECYKLLIEDSSDAIIIHTDKRIVFANDAASKLCGFTKAEELIDLPIRNFTPNDEKSKSKERIRNAIKFKKSFQFDDSKIVNAEGKIMDVRTKATYIFYEGKPSLLVVFKDLSDQRQVDKLTIDIEEKNKMLGETLELNRLITEHFSNVSHEIRTPLNVILGAIQVLGYYNVDNSMDNKEKVGAYYKTIKQNCYRLLRLVNNLIDLSKIDSGFFKLNQRNGNIVNVVEDITLSVKNYVESKGITLIFDTDVEEKYMSFDHDKIERIILNLLSNAVKFTKEGGEILVSIEDIESSIEIIVKDTGEGIPNDKLGIIFERYRQVDMPLSKRNQGTGIGLSLVKSLVELHGGHIEVKSKLGEGTEFSIVLPVQLVEGETEDFRQVAVSSNVEIISIEFSDIYDLSS